MATRDEVVRLREKGLTYAKIGSRFGINKERVRRILTPKPPKPAPQKPTLESKVMLRVGEVAGLLGLHSNTVRRWEDKGVLRAYRIGTRGDRRFRREDVDGFLKERANPVHLAPREFEVLRLLADGKSNREIAVILSIGYQTAKNYVKSIMEKTKSNNRTQAALSAINRGLIKRWEGLPRNKPVPGNSFIPSGIGTKKGERRTGTIGEAEYQAVLWRDTLTERS